MQISYKFWYITREDDVHISEAAIRFYEGEDKDVTFKDFFSGKEKTEKRYVRTKRLKPKDIPELDGTFRQESDGSYCRVYTSADFGTLTSDDELRLFVNKEMAKHKGRTLQKDQAEVSDVKKVK